MTKDQKNFALTNINALITIYRLIQENSEGFFGVFARNKFKDIYNEYESKSNKKTLNEAVNIENIEFIFLIILFLFFFF